LLFRWQKLFHFSFQISQNGGSIHHAVALLIYLEAKSTADLLPFSNVEISPL
jgi:hypothetical protein